MHKKETLFPKIHETQWLILRKMVSKEEWRFNELKFVDMDPKLFTYHLKQLQRSRLVTYDLKFQKYMLDRNGRLLMDYFRNIPNFAEFPINTSILLYAKRDKEVLVVKRRKIPSLNHIGNPSSNTLTTEPIATTAKKLLKSFGLSGELYFCLLLEMLYHHKDKTPFTHDCFYVFYVNEPEGTCRKKCDEGELSWLHPHELLKAKKGYKNTKDIISYFEDPNFDQGKLHFVSKSYPKEY